MNAELIVKEKTILDLTERVAAQERESTIWKEKVARETEVEMKTKYPKEIFPPLSSTLYKEVNKEREKKMTAEDTKHCDRTSRRPFWTN